MENCNQCYAGADQQLVVFLHSGDNFMSVGKAEGETVTVEVFASEHYVTCISCEEIVAETGTGCEAGNIRNSEALPY